MKFCANGRPIGMIGIGVYQPWSEHRREPRKVNGRDARQSGKFAAVSAFMTAHFVVPSSHGDMLNSSYPLRAHVFAAAAMRRTGHPRV
jgi:hypothetical protein